MAVDIVGAGRVGCALHERAQARGTAGVLVSRTEGWEALAAGPVGRPILVATRNDDVADVVARVPPARRDDLVFVQNGMIRPLLAELGLGEPTRGILFLAVATRGGPLEVGGASPFTGPHAEAVVAWLRDLGVDAEVTDVARFAAVELEKLVWIAAFGVLSPALDAPVGEVAERHRAELRPLVEELVAVAAPVLGVEVDLDDLVERLVAYARSIAGWRGAIKEWRWRNGWFLEEAERRGIPTPHHRAWLARAGWSGVTSR